jgi:hypothetical protein
VGPLLAVVGLALLVAGCGASPLVSRHTPTPRATATASPAGTRVTTPASTPAPTAATGPVQATLTAADLATMTSAWVTYRESGQPPDFVGYPGLYPSGSITVGKSSAALMPDGGEWAIVMYALANRSTATQDQLVSMQDGASVGVYFRTSPKSAWVLRGLEIGGCGAIPGLGVPPDVATLLGIPDPCN